MKFRLERIEHHHYVTAYVTAKLHFPLRPNEPDARVATLSFMPTNTDDVEKMIAIIRRDRTIDDAVNFFLSLAPDLEMRIQLERTISRIAIRVLLNRTEDVTDG